MQSLDAFRTLLALQDYVLQFMSETQTTAIIYASIHTFLYVQLIKIRAFNDILMMNGNLLQTAIMCSELEG